MASEERKKHLNECIRLMSRSDVHLHFNQAMSRKNFQHDHFQNITAFGEESNKETFAIEIFFFVLNLFSLGAKVSVIIRSVK